MTNDTLLTERLAADMLDIHRVTLAVWRQDGRGPKYVKLGRNVRYRRSDVEAYIRKNTIEPTAS